MKAHVVEMLKLGGEYHEVGWQTYLQWLVERGLKNEIRYYGWEELRAKTLDRGRLPTRLESQDMQKLIRLANRRAKVAEAVKNKKFDEAP
jgi:hypothetical protein